MSLTRTRRSVLSSFPVTNVKTDIMPSPPCAVKTGGNERRRLSFGNRLPYYYILASKIDRKTRLLRRTSVISKQKTHISTHFRTKNNPP